MTPPPAPRGLSDDERRMWAIGTHASALVCSMIGGLGSFVGPLVIWLIRRDDDPYVAGHALEALNFNITVDLILAIGIFLGIITFGLGFLLIAPLLLVLGIIWLVFTIQGLLAASRGETFRYPMSIRMVR